MSDRLFSVDDIPEVPLFRDPPARVKAARGVALDARFANDYPPEWTTCSPCHGRGRVFVHPDGSIDTRPLGDDMRRAAFSGTLPEALVERGFSWETCAGCLGMGSLKGRVRLESGHRCVRCLHPFVTKNDAKMLGVDPTPGRWSPCDASCTHGGPVRILVPEGDEPFGSGEWLETTLLAPFTVGGQISESGGQPYEAEWRILTVHHFDGDKANCRWWNLGALCQRCHLEIQAKVVMERVYPHEHSEWFKPYVAGYYAHVYLGEDLDRLAVLERMDELLALEQA